MGVPARGDLGPRMINEPVVTPRLDRHSGGITKTPANLTGRRQNYPFYKILEPQHQDPTALEAFACLRTSLGGMRHGTLVKYRSANIWLQLGMLSSL